MIYRQLRAAIKHAHALADQEQREIGLSKVQDWQGKETFVVVRNHNRPDSLADAGGVFGSIVYRAQPGEKAPTPKRALGTPPRNCYTCGEVIRERPYCARDKSYPRYFCSARCKRDFTHPHGRERVCDDPQSHEHAESVHGSHLDGAPIARADQ